MEEPTIPADRLDAAALAQAGDALRTFGQAAQTVLLPAFRALAAGLNAAARSFFFLAGYRAGRALLPRDWEMPDDWHRGYLRGRLAGLRDRAAQAGK